MNSEDERKIKTPQRHGEQKIETYGPMAGFISERAVNAGALDDVRLRSAAAGRLGSTTHASAIK